MSAWNFTSNKFLYEGHFWKTTDEDCAEVWDAEATTEMGTAFEEISAKIKELIKYDKGGIPYQYGEDDQGSYEMNEKQSYDHIVNEVRRLVDKLSVPLSELQAATNKNQAAMWELLDMAPENRGMWQITGGDEKWKRTIVNELTKDLNKPYMWKETVQEEDKSEDNTFKSSTGIEFKIN